VDHEGHVEISSGERRTSFSLSDVERHFDRARLREFFVSLDLDDLGPVRTADHECVRLRCVPRPNGQLWPHWLPYGADEYEFHAEPRRGVVLGIIARHGGEVFEINEVTQVAFDEAMEDSLFTYTPLGGEQVRPADTIVEQLTLDAAVARMPFTVLVPMHLPDSGHTDFEVMYHPPRMRSPREHLSLMYRGDECDRLWVYEGATPDPELSEFDWELVRHGGKDLRLSDPGDSGMRVVAFEQHETHVTIFSDLARERLLALASSFIPASPQTSAPPS
jgi:hypothetical protein